MKEFNRNDFLNLTVYQIYPRSFCDSNGDGIGDIKGIISKLEYLKDLGVNAVWLCPCYKSPKCDNGYDISDYRTIDQDYGDFDDIKTLISELHKRDMKLIMDFVANHTSDKHEWFKEARKSKDSPYHDYYIWADKPLNDWQCCFSGSAWQYNGQTDEYYLHSFAIGQPDLNWKNPAVRKEMRAIVNFWIDLGVDGFRCDVLDFIGKNFDKNLMCGDESMHAYINEIFGRKKTKRIFTVGECQSTEKDIADICGEDRGELTTVFQFEHFGVGRGSKWEKREFAFDDVKNILVKWQYFSAKHGLLYTLFTDNHDQNYYLTRTGNDKGWRYECATAYAATFYLLKGIPFIYQGQEFGSCGSRYEKIEDFGDVESVNYYNEQEIKREYPRYEVINQINFGGRDNPRRPVAWSADESTGYGFGSTAPWLRFNSRAKEINLENDKKSQKSVFGFYKKLLSFRKNNDAIIYGDFKELLPAENCNSGFFAYERTFQDKRVVVIINFDREQKISLPIDKNYKLILNNYAGYKVFNDYFRPFEVAVYEKI